MQCKANAKQTGEQCKRHAASGREVCAIHGGKSTGPIDQSGNENAVSHGAYSTVMAEQINDSVFGAISSDPGLETEMRIARYKLWRLLEPEILQNISGGEGVETVKADEFAKATGAALLISEIRKLSKDMQSTGSEQALKDFLAGVDTVRAQQAEDLSE